MNTSCRCWWASFRPLALFLSACALAHAASTPADDNSSLAVFTAAPTADSAPSAPDWNQDAFATWAQSAPERAPLPGAGLNTRSERLQLFGDLFTPGELSFLTTASNVASATRAGLRSDPGATTASAYAGAISTALIYDAGSAADAWPGLTSWSANGARLGTRLENQAIPMALDFTRRNPFYSSGNSGTAYWIERTFVILPMPHGSRSMEFGGNALRLGTLEFMAGDGRRHSAAGPANDFRSFCALWLKRAASVTMAELLNAGLTHQPAPPPGRVVATRKTPEYPVTLSYSY